jgi:hypothetical protein
MAAGRPARVHLTGDRVGAYIVSEERADGSLVLTPDSSRRRRVAVDSPGTLAQLLFRRRQEERFPTSREALDAWGVALLEDESIAEFAMADVDKEHGYVAVTSERVIFLVRSAGSLAPRWEHSLGQFLSVGESARRGKGAVVIEWHDAAPTVIESRDRAALERLRASLLAHRRA